MEENTKLEVAEAEVVEVDKSDKSARMKEFWDSMTPEQRRSFIEKTNEAKALAHKEKKEIEIATKFLMKQKFRYRNAEGKIVIGNGYEARANAMFKEVVERGKNMVAADKQLQSYLGEDKVENQVNNQINVVFQVGQEIDI